MTWIIFAFASISFAASALSLSSCAVVGYLYLMESAAFPPPRCAFATAGEVRASVQQAASVMRRTCWIAIERAPVMGGSGLKERAADQGERSHIKYRRWQPPARDHRGQFVRLPN